MSVWRIIEQDLAEWKQIGFLGNQARTTEVTLREALALYWRYTPVRATILFRLSHAAHERRIPMVSGWLARRNLRHYGLDITPSTRIGPGLYIPHTVGTVVTAQEIGSHCHIIAAVTIGMRNVHAFPRIGDHVTIGAGARVLGGITVGHHASIGANAVVIHDIPDGATAVGIPARIVRRGDDTGARNADKRAAKKRLASRASA